MEFCILQVFMAWRLGFLGFSVQLQGNTCVCMQATIDELRAQLGQVDGDAASVAVEVEQARAVRGCLSLCGMILVQLVSQTLHMGQNCKRLPLRMHQAPQYFAPNHCPPGGSTRSTRAFRCAAAFDSRAACRDARRAASRGSTAASRFAAGSSGGGSTAHCWCCGNNSACF